MNILYRLPIKVWSVVVGLFILPFGIIMSVGYILFSLLMLELPSLDNKSNDLTKHSVKKIVNFW